MFSSKSSSLIALLASSTKEGKKVRVFKPSNDTRYKEDAIVSHDGLHFPAVNLDVKNLYHQALDYLNDLTDLVVFDEAQFFEAEPMVKLIKHLLSSKIEVVCAGLSQDSFGEPFGAMPVLMALADEVISLKATCAKCFTPKSATRTFRKTKVTEQVVVGGVDIYEPRCFTCWKF